MSNSTFFDIIALERDDLEILYRSSDGESPSSTTAEQHNLAPILGRSPTDMDDARSIGIDLWKAVFDNAIGAALAGAIANAEMRNKILRVRLCRHVSHKTTLPLLIPWEALFVQPLDRHLVLHPHQVVFSRYVAQQRPIAAAQLPCPIRVLLTSGPSTTLGLPYIGLESELSEVADVVKTSSRGRIVLKALPDTQARTIQQWLTQSAKLDTRPMTIWHHCGHGIGGNAGHPFELALPNGRGSDTTQLEEIESIVSGANLMCAFLNVCYGANNNSAAARLAGLNVPITVGYDGAIDDTPPKAKTFALAIYRALASGDALDVAIAKARRELANAYPWSGDWARVVCYTRLDYTKFGQVSDVDNTAFSLGS